MFKGRDGCRTPMPWTKDAEQAGFSTAAPWLPIPLAHAEKAVDTQETDPKSILNSYRHFLAWRKQQPILISGDIRFVNANESILAFERHFEEKKMLVLFNLSNQNTVFAVDTYQLNAELNEHGLLAGQQIGTVVELPPFGSYFANIK